MLLLLLVDEPSLGKAVYNTYVAIHGVFSVKLYSFSVPGRAEGENDCSQDPICVPRSISKDGRICSLLRNLNSVLQLQGVFRKSVGLCMCTTDHRPLPRAMNIIMQPQRTNQHNYSITSQHSCPLVSLGVCLYRSTAGQGSTPTTAGLPHGSGHRQGQQKTHFFTKSCLCLGSPLLYVESALHYVGSVLCVGSLQGKGLGHNTE